MRLSLSARQELIRNAFHRSAVKATTLLVSSGIFRQPPFLELGEKVQRTQNMARQSGATTGALRAKLILYKQARKPIKSSIRPQRACTCNHLAAMVTSVLQQDSPTEYSQQPTSSNRSKRTQLIQSNIHVSRMQLILSPLYRQPVFTTGTLSLPLG